MKTSIDILKSWFQTGDKPTENQFSNLIDSFHHKDDGQIITSYQLFNNGNVSFTFSDGVTANVEKFVLPSTMPQNFITGLVDALNKKVNKETGKQLSEENFSLKLRQKLEQLENYIHPDFHKITEIEGLQGVLESKVDKVDGKQLSEESFTTEEKEKLTGLENYNAPTSRPISYIETLQDTLDVIDQSIKNKVEKEEGKELSSNNFSDEEKEKLSNLNPVVTFSSVTNGEETLFSRNDSDVLTFEGVVIDGDERVLKINPIVEGLDVESVTVKVGQSELASLNSAAVDSSYVLNVAYNNVADGLSGHYLSYRKLATTESVVKKGYLDAKIEQLNKLNQLILLIEGNETLYLERDSVAEDKLSSNWGVFKIHKTRLNLKDMENDTLLKWKMMVLPVREEEDENKYVTETELANLKAVVDTKVQKEEGKKLSSNDYTDLEREKLLNVKPTIAFGSITDGVNTIVSENASDVLTFEGVVVDKVNKKIKVSSGGVNFIDNNSGAFTANSDLDNSVVNALTNVTIRFTKEGTYSFGVSPRGISKVKYEFPSDWTTSPSDFSEIIFRDHLVVIKDNKTATFY